MMNWVKKADDLLTVRPLDYTATIIEEEEILRWFDLCDAYWMHDGDTNKPHAELTSGKCSNGFFDCMILLKYPNICELLAMQFYLRFKEEIGGGVDWVIGSPYAAITFSYEVAKYFEARHGFCEKDPNPERQKQFLWRRLEMPEGARVLQIEELITTSQTFRNIRLAVGEGNPKWVNFLPVVGAFIHRPPRLPANYGDVRVLALIEREVWAVEPEECSLCQAGSKRVRPKTHWAELTGKA